MAAESAAGAALVLSSAAISENSPGAVSAEGGWPFCSMSSVRVAAFALSTRQQLSAQPVRAVVSVRKDLQSADMVQPNPVFSGLPTTIFTVMSALATEHGAINLGQGFPDEDGPIAIRESAAAALREGPNQYPPTRGVPALKQAIAAHAKRFYGFDFDSDRNVLVTSGGTEALTASILALAGEGGEVVLIEPAYDSYRPIALAAGARVKTLQLEPPGWRLKEEALAEVVTPDTRVVMLNTPLNP